MKPLLRLDARRVAKQLCQSRLIDQLFHLRREVRQIARQQPGFLVRNRVAVPDHIGDDAG
jgi:hypothetical protein